MQRIDLKGQRFGMLVALYHGEPYIKPSGQKISTWVCRCDCGQMVTVRTENLRNKHTTSCGCKRGHSPMVGEQYGLLTVVSESSYGMVKCQCACGNELFVKTSNLNIGNTQSCGCLQRKRSSESGIKPLNGKRFGKLTVLGRVENNRYKHVQYRCRCDCGGEIITEAGRLRAGRVQSCGCTKSIGEMKISNWLLSHKVLFRAQYSHGDIFFSKTKRRPFFDFAVFDKNKELLFIIEYQGSQHYGFSGYGWDTEENHNKTVQRDIEKRNLCSSFGIPLYEINELDLRFIDEILDSIIQHYPNVGYLEKEKYDE